MASSPVTTSTSIPETLSWVAKHDDLPAPRPRFAPAFARCAVNVNGVALCYICPSTGRPMDDVWAWVHPSKGEEYNGKLFWFKPGTLDGGIWCHDPDYPSWIRLRLFAVPRGVLGQADRDCMLRGAELRGPSTFP